mmetsp:Transcript_11231/g.20755  ORF Transcript_11231/g.20755 Transcript_11231/m.20755 type:complete len:380 (-) Transcript_11231:98-1237(-)
MSGVTSPNLREALSKRRKLSESLNVQVDDLRIDSIGPLLPPACLIEEVPLDQDVVSHVASSREAVHAVVNKSDDRVIVIVGPCSIHDTKAGLEYAQKLAPIAKEIVNEVLVIMRVYFEKPRTTVGWKGLINDPDMNGSFQINKGLRMGREFLLDVNKLGLPAAVELLDTLSPQFLGDLISWGAIGARTTESQVHRELASGMSCPIGFKNATAGDVKVAVDACGSAANPHSFLSVTKQGLAAIVHTKGNLGCHIILRGGASGTNFDEESVKAACKVMESSGLEPRVMVDCSHGNSKKDHKNQAGVAEEVCRQIAAGDKSIIGFMIESHLFEGKQKLEPGQTDLSTLKYGVSVTDACINMDETEAILKKIAEAVKQRRNAN